MTWIRWARGLTFVVLVGALTLSQQSAVKAGEIASCDVRDGCDTYDFLVSNCSTYGGFNCSDFWNECDFRCMMSGGYVTGYYGYCSGGPTTNLVESNSPWCTCSETFQMDDCTG